MENLNKIKRNFQEQGFAIIKNIFNKKNIRSLMKEIDRVKRKSIEIKNPHLHYTKDKKINTIHNINRYIKKGTINKISNNKKILNVVRHILKSKTKVRNIEFFLKPKKTGLESPFHQDNYYWNFLNKDQALNVWIACSDSNYKNGGVCYFEKSHKLGLLKHKVSFAPGSSQKIPSTYLKKIKLKKVIPSLKSGDCIIHHSQVVHGSGPNKSDKDRIGFVISYKKASAKINKKKLQEYKKKVKKNLFFLKKGK
tara:strand:+ start:2234 stop:2989 length:756 start_codon:yes stop_codon:yes gene_type:complete